VSGEAITLVEASYEDGKPLTILSDTTLKLQSGDRALAYRTIYHQIADYVSDHQIDNIIIKASAVNQRGMTQSHLFAAELRGLAIAAAATGAPVKLINVAQVSRNYGSRKFDDYIKDDAFWKNEIDGKPLRKGSRDAALLLLNEAS